MPSNSMEHTEAAKEPTAAEAAVEKPTLWGGSRTASLSIAAIRSPTTMHVCYIRQQFSQTDIGGDSVANYVSS
jgi:hypothetical protein